MKIQPNILMGKKYIHFIGVGGSGMFPLAQILLKQGYIISGSDNNPGDTIDQERAMGMRVIMGQSAENIRGADVIVYSAAIMEDNPELIAARKSGLPVLERSELLGLITSHYKNCIAVSGTHGKTTTTSLLTHILLQAGADPTTVIGGKLREIGGSGRVGNSDIMICEACEFVDTFLHLYPDIAVILNIDADHLDYFKTLDNIIHSFHRFASMASKCVICNGDDANTLKAVKGCGKPVLTFGYGENNDYRACQVRPRIGEVGYEYELEHEGKRVVTIRTSLPGKHNVYNSLAAIAAAIYAGVDAQSAAALTETFTGAARRFEILGVRNGVTIADDYAHHPREIEATLLAAREMGYKRIWAVHQPFTFSRTALLLKEFARVLSLADCTVLSEIMGGREYNTYDIYAKDLAQLIPGCVWFNTFEEIANYVMQEAKEGDLVITLGCGDVYKCAKMMLKN